MNISQQLIDKFLSNQCSAEEADFVVHYFEEHPEALEEYINEEEWQHFKNTAQLPVDTEQEMWREVKRRAFPASGIRRMGWVRAAAAVMLLLAAGSTWWILKQTQHNSLPVVALQQPAALPLIHTITNTTHKSRLLQLEDGSEVTLLPNSILQYQQPFGAAQRQLQLTGKAFFKVAQDQQKPFVVTAGGLTTTVLGTSFWITAYDSTAQVQVQLISGRVVVKKDTANAGHSFSPVYLSAGQQLVFNQQNEKAIVSAISVHNNRVGNRQSNQADGPSKLVFSQTPLIAVIRQLQEKYHVTIAFDSAQIHHIKFSGAYTTGEDVGDILKTIVLVNDLKLTKTASGYRINQ
ncbi:FecR domain-containing protein [Chitinophaga sp. 212800010-3]|uniref:FecR family protein n=1 Tax=unclassified Chitinophaga TaxID=2619133 RepID=UPI002DE899DD|nr:hypothetical protein [Chitinophaga sp. 212800010-3]